MCPKSTPAILNDSDWLREQYAAKSTHTIAAELGCSVTPIRERLRRFGIAPTANKHRNAGIRDSRGGQVARFWARVDKRGPDDCWPWLGSFRNGYGRMRFDDRNQQATHIVWQLTNGPIPDGVFLCHRCDNPRCCNPAHLFLGTPLDNVRDMAAKERAARGSSRNLGHLTEADVRELRRLHATEGLTHAELGERFGISRSMAGLIVNRKNWTHVD